MDGYADDYIEGGGIFDCYYQDKVSRTNSLLTLLVFGSSQPRSPKVCPEGNQIFLKFQSHTFCTSIFRDVLIFTKFYKIFKYFRFVFGPIFRKLNFDIGIKSGFGQLIFSNTTGKTSQTT